MEPSEAHDHLAMVERIIAASSRKLEAGGEYFIVWGLASTGLDVLLQLIINQQLPVASLWGAAALGVLAILFTIWRRRQTRKDLQMSFLQREFFNVLWIALAMAFVCNLIGSHLFANWALSGIWNVAGSIVLFFIAVHGNRRAMIGGILLIVSIALANYQPAIAGFALAGGMLLGYAGFGLLDILARE